MLIGMIGVGLIGVPVSLAAHFGAASTVLAVAADLLFALISAGALLILRRGRFRLAVLAGVGGQLLAIALTYFAIGARAGDVTLIIFTLPITMAGLLTGRRGLLLVLGASLLIVFGSALFDLRSISGQLETPNELPHSVIWIVFALVIGALGLFIDRFRAALRSALSAMQLREQQLEASRSAIELRSAALEREVIERRRAEAALRDSEERFRALVTHLPVGIFQTAPNGACLFVNQQWCAFAGMAPEEALGYGWIRAIHPDDLEYVRASWSAAVSQGQPFKGEYRFVHPDRSVIWLFGTASPLRDARGEVLGYFGIVSDITESKRAGEALRASDERYRLIAENTSELINLFELGDTITLAYSSPSYHHVLGYKKVNSPGAPNFSVVHPDDHALMNELFSQLRQGNDSQATVRVRHADGSWRWIESNASSLLREGRRYGLVVGRDITDRRRLEEQFLQAQKMESIGQLAGGIAHDFNNLLTTIIGNTELALDELPHEHPAWVDVHEIAGAAERAVGLTRQLLAFARKQILDPHVIDLAELLEAMGALLHRLIGEDIELHMINQPDLWRIKCDRNQIEQVLINLAVNARDAMPDGGRLALATTNVWLREAAAYHKIGVPPGRYVLLAVSDTGMGMDEPTQRHAFEPFFTTKPTGRGTGLGLATCYGIVNQHGGTIWLSSELGLGTTVEVYLPAVDDPAEPLATPEPAALPRGSEAILLVEDEPAVRALAARVLRTQGYRVIEAEHGRAALELIEAGDPPPIDMLLTDVVMPQIGGKAIASQLQQRYPQLKVLYISGYTDHAIVHHGRLDPGLAFLHKPFTPAALARKVRLVLDSDTKT